MSESRDEDRPRAESSPGDAVEIEETTVIRAEIVDTRERMSDTLDEIGERLNPHVVKEQVTERVKDGIRDATIGRVENMARNTADKVQEARSSIADTIRDNPIPASMIAIGLGWLMWNGRADRSENRYRGQYRGVSPYAGGAYGYGAGATGYGAGATGTGAAYRGFEESDESRGTVDRARERASQLGDKAKQRAGDMAHRAQHAGESVIEGAHDLADTVVDRTKRGAGRVEDTFYENPIAIGAVTVALGIAAGLAAPTTDREVKLMGDARDRLVDRVKDTVEETVDKAEHVAERVVDETKTAAREEGLTPSV
jgi:ElaB/YqjD/DUF883 family membrane-anchored ribosome-binding protein